MFSLVTPHSPGALMNRLMRRASLRANELLAVPGATTRVAARAADGFSVVERLALSPSAEDQLVAVGLRLTLGGRYPDVPMIGKLVHHFALHSPSYEIERLRSAVLAEFRRHGLPAELTRVEIARLEREARHDGAERGPDLHSFSTLYSQLWCDPRIDAPPATRLVMRAVAKGLESRFERSPRVARPAWIMS